MQEIIIKLTNHAILNFYICKFLYLIYVVILKEGLVIF